MAEYTTEVIKVVVAKICQTIGWHSIHTAPLEILIDIMQRYLSEIAKLTQWYAVQFGHTQPNLDELGLAFRDMHINIADLEEYVRNVDSSPALEVPEYPIPKESHLNFLKPGSNEVVTRPVHVHEHLPPMHPETEDVETPVPNVKQEDAQLPTNSELAPAIFKRPADISPSETMNKRPRLMMEEEGRPTREISSVMMTTSGFLSPAREGKLPEPRTPANTIEMPTSVAHAPPTNETRVEKKIPKLVKEPKKAEKRKEKASKELFKPGFDEPPAKKMTAKEVNKAKCAKSNIIAGLNAHLAETPPPKVPNVKNTAATTKAAKVQQKAVKAEKAFSPVPTPPPVQKPVPPVPTPGDKVVEGKLSSEPDKQKLNIFKKISKVKDDKVEKNKIKEDNSRPDEVPVPESRESSPDLIIDEPNVKSWDQNKAPSTKPVDLEPVKQEPEKSKKVAPPTIVDLTKVYEVKSPHSDKDFLYDDDISPPGTPSTPKTPEMPSDSPPLKIEPKETKRKRKEKNKIKTKNKVPKTSLSPRRSKIDNSETEMDRPKTPNGPVCNVKEEPMSTVPSQSQVPMHAHSQGQGQSQAACPPVFPFFPNFIPRPGLIPSPLFLPKAGGFGQPAHMPASIPPLPFVPPVKTMPPVEEVVEKPPVQRPAETPSPPVDQVDFPQTTTKEKHKKDKKDKLKKKNKKDKIKNKSEKRKLKEEKKEKEKEKAKKEKKEKKKEKEREHEGSVPKLTLRIGSPRPPTPDAQIARKIMIKPIVKKEEPEPVACSTSTSTEKEEQREPSPELARISALITRPPKLKPAKESHGSKEESGNTQSSTSPKQTGPMAGRSSRISSNMNKNSVMASMSSVSIAGVKSVPGKTQKPVLYKQQSSVVDNDGNKVWICPACGGQDDGSPMIGCDDCDAWYHWVCVGIQVPPDQNEDWYCRVCIGKKQETLQMDKKKKRKKKEKKEH